MHPMSRVGLGGQVGGGGSHLCRLQKGHSVRQARVPGRDAVLRCRRQSPPRRYYSHRRCCCRHSPGCRRSSRGRCRRNLGERKEGAELQGPPRRARGGRAPGSAGRWAASAVWAGPQGRLASSASGWARWPLPVGEIPLWPYRHCQIHYSRLRRRHNRHRGCHQTHLKRTNRCGSIRPRGAGWFRAAGEKSSGCRNPGVEGGEGAALWPGRGGPGAGAVAAGAAAAFGLGFELRLEPTASLAAGSRTGPAEPLTTAAEVAAATEVVVTAESASAAAAKIPGTAAA